MIRVPDPVFPSDADIDAAIQALHDNPLRAVISVTGGALGLQQLLWNVPGSSRTLLAGFAPYAMEATEQHLGRKPQRYCSAETAGLLAGAALDRAQAVAGHDPKIKIVGLGVTVALATDRVRRGAHVIYAAVMGDLAHPVDDLAFELTPEEAQGWSRKVQGRLSDLLALNLLLEAAGLRALAIEYPSRAPAEDLIPSKGTIVWPDGCRKEMSSLDPVRHVLFPGSFNPVHDGHLTMAMRALSEHGLRAVFVINNDHPDKGRLTREDLARRASQFAWKHPVGVTEDMGLYVQKAAHFPGFGFLVGADTAFRVFDPKYYGNEAGQVGISHAEMLETFRRCRTVLYVFDRPQKDGTIRTVDDIPEAHLPAELRACLCVRIVSRLDISSTELRAQGLHP